MKDRRTVRRAAPRRVRAYVGLGANLGDARATLAWAVRALAGLPSVRLRGVSRLYVTAPWGVTDQPDFHNAVAAVEVPAGPDPAAGALALMEALKSLERDAGRRGGKRWGPRELDLDLLVFGRHRILVERPSEARSLDAAVDPDKAARPLEVPHRHAGERLFVLAPLADLAPRLVPPGWGVTVESRRREVAATETPDAVRAVGTWDPGRGAWVRPSASDAKRATIGRAKRASSMGGPTTEDP
jgi:2-amino-4-hydroxy-6-hydroxymethyldihydropteridine diphosphokinase